MKKILLLFIIINIHLLNSQITYIIPDIGTPGMSTYTEIIGPANIANIFGNDGLYVNSNELHIVFENPSDSKKLEFGPLIVTWNGRMIATQVFVNPNLKPNSSCWDSLTSEFRIAFRIGNQITVSNIDTFYIVKPYNLTNLSSNPDRTFGKQSLGVRSRRGAMIVDSLDLANSSYGVSMLDCDPYTAGNQAYLPFILLSKKNITGGNNTVYMLMPLVRMEVLEEEGAEEDFVTEHC